MRPAAPLRLRIVTCWPHRCERRSATIRAITSGPLPGAVWIMTDTWRDGYVSATATEQTAQMAARTEQSAYKAWREVIGVPPGEWRPWLPQGRLQMQPP